MVSKVVLEASNHQDYAVENVECRSTDASGEAIGSHSIELLYMVAIGACCMV
jgi:hypothetical protein